MRKLATLLLMFIPACSFAAQSDWRYTTAAQQDSAPKYSVSGNGVTGLCVDIYRAIEKADPEITISGDQNVFPLARLEESVLSGELDMFCGLAENPQRKESFHFVMPSIFSVTYHLAVRSDDSVAVASWDDVRQLGKEGVILINNGNGAIGRLQAMGGLTIDDGARTMAANLDKLLGNRGRFIYYRSPGFQGELEQNGAASKVKILPTVLETQPFYLLMNRNISPERKSRLEAALQKLAADGTLSQISAKYR